jgi:hypothetical protein
MAIAKKVAKKSVAKSVKAPAVQTHGDRIDWRSLYLYAVCLITLLVVLFSTVSLINAIMNTIFPNPVYIDVYAKPENAPLPELVEQQERDNQIQAIKGIFSSFITISVAAPLYLYHWRQTKK